MNAPRDDAAARTSMEAYFNGLADALERALVAGEAYTAWFSAEVSDFVRMNRGRVRQPGTVAQRYLDVRLIRGAAHASHRLTLSGQPPEDRERLRAAIAGLRTALADLDDDPHLLIATGAHSARTVRGGPLPPAEAVVDALLDAARGEDLVGLYAGGPLYRGFASSHGQRSWHEVGLFNLQWSLHHRGDKAVKATLSGFAWDGRALDARMAQARADLAHVAKPAKSLAPGRYRAYLAPAAMDNIVSLLGWGGFSARALATRQSSLARMQGGDAAGGERLDPRVTLAEAVADGVAPPFQPEGFARPARIPLVDGGRLVGSLVSPRTARELSLATNGANAYEAPEALEMGGGALPAADALAALGTGLWVGNVHYLNYSDRPACRMTGMTRFATFWVERGRVVAPVNVLRFDDTAFRVLGANLEALTRETELLVDTGTYRERDLASVRVPGALVSALAFTL